MIYVVKSGTYFKVGYSKDIKKRMQGYLTHTPDAELILYTDEGDTLLEKHIHKSLTKYHHKNEWFNIFEGYEAYISEIISTFEIGSFKDLVKDIQEKYKSDKSGFKQEVNPFILNMSI
jgi:hypothetical protein